MNYWENNLESIQFKSERLHEVLVDYQRKESNISVQQSMDGSSILCVEDGDGFIPLNSIYNPEVEAQYYARVFKALNAYSTLVVFGLGNGVIVREILKVIPKNAFLFIYEPSIDIFTVALYEFDLTDIIDDNRVQLFVEGMNDGQFELYLDAYLNHENYMQSYIKSLPKYKILYEMKYEEVYNRYLDRCKFVKMDINTRVKEKEVLMVNPLRNLEYTFHSKSAEDYKKIFTEDMTGILVAAGPSLEKNIDQLKKAKGKAFILAVDTAAIYLLNQGIVPDMVAAIDYKKPLRLFDDDRLIHVPLVVITDFNHNVMERLDGNDFVFGSSNSPLYDKYFNVMGKQIAGLPQGGSVATFGFSLLQYWGFKKVILVGQDLAHTGDQQHAGEQKIKREDIKRDIIEIEGNVEEKVYTTADYYAYLKWFEMAVDYYYSNGEVINATEGGAKIHGTRIMTLKEAMKEYCNQDYDFDTLQASVPYVVSEDKYQEAYDYLLTQKKTIENLKRVIKSAMNSSERVQKLVERGDTFSKEFKKLNKELQTACDKYEEADVATIISAMCADVEIDSVSDLYVEEEDQTEEMKRLYQKLHENYKNYYENIDEIIDTFQDVLDRIAEKYQLKTVD